LTRKYFLQTERLGFRLWNHSDRELALCLWGDPEVTRLFSKDPLSQEQVERGQGLASEAARAVIAHAFEELGAGALFAGHHPDNASSRRVLKKLGFVETRSELFEGTGLMHPGYLLLRAQKTTQREPF